MKITSCDCLDDYDIEYCNENYPESYYLGEYNIINSKGVVIEHGIGCCPFCGKVIKVWIEEN